MPTFLFDFRIFFWDSLQVMGYVAGWWLMVTSEGTKGLMVYKNSHHPRDLRRNGANVPYRWRFFFPGGAWLLKESFQGIGLGGFSHPKASGVEPLVTLGPKSFKAENLPWKVASQRVQREYNRRAGLTLLHISGFFVKQLVWGWYSNTVIQ